MEKLTLGHRQLGPDGIVIGGEGFELRRERAPAVLLLHGAGDTPQTLRYLGNYLHARGFHVTAPLLPGHGRGLRDFSRVSAGALSAAAREDYERLRSGHPWVGIVGLSMGGALAVQLAARNDQLPALVLLAPYLGMPRWIERAARLSWLWGPLVPAVHSGDARSVLDAEERERGLAYGVFTPAALRALQITLQRAVDDLPHVLAPTLVIQSRQDNRISPDVAEGAFARLGAREKRLEWITDAGHVITVDRGREAVFAATANWLSAHAEGSRYAS